MTSTKPTWSETFFGLIDVIAERSDDPRTKLGAIIADEFHRITGIGYNGLPRGIRPTEERLQPPEKYRWMVHAEENAILNAQRTDGCTLYVPIFPCAACARTIIQAGIARVVLSADRCEKYAKAPGRHAEDQTAVLEMLHEGGVEIEFA